MGIKKREAEKAGFFEIICFNIFVFAVLIIGSQGIFAASLTCVINSSSECGGTRVFNLQNDTGGNTNAHAQNATVSFANYSYAVCCTSDEVLSNLCSDGSAIRLYNLTNSHVQKGDYSGPGSIYSNGACFSSDPGFLSCIAEQNGASSSCASSGYTCLASMASSEPGDANATNSHVGPCDKYDMKICCSIAAAPVIFNVTLNSSLGTNYTAENLTVYFVETSSASGRNLTNITDWRIEGKSIAVLNMAFNTNVSSLEAKKVRDYSSFGNNGTLGGGNSANAPVWNRTGKPGGSYNFDGNNDYINITNSNSIKSISTAGSISVWTTLYNLPSSRGAIDTIVDPASTGSQGLVLFVSDTNDKVIFQLGNGTSTIQLLSTSALSTNRWYHIVGTWNLTYSALYVDGVVNSTNTGAVNISISQEDTYIGSNSGSLRFHNGTIDEVQIYNRTLSARQIDLIYQAGLGNRSVQKMHSDETVKHENWSVAVTGSDGYSEGNTNVSINLTIRNSLPNVTLSNPEDGNVTTNRTPLFTWAGSDDDGDVFNFQINISAKPTGSDDNRLVNTSQANYSSLLKYLADNGYYYEWSVRANDSEGFGSWTSVRKINITSLIDINATTRFIQFGSIGLLAFNDTTTNSPAPFVIQNDGNSLVNVSVNGSSLWLTQANPSQYYRFKIDNESSNNGSFDWASSLTAWTNMPLAASTAIAQFNNSNDKDAAEVDIYVKVPGGENPGNKTSIVTFLASLAE